ncbi:hypothetical protein OK074_8670 [Actinobacteria bacterium OK074]|nr:hypothetical protein OK074_8670 [Actinobacteria bacterium OK074]
MDKTAQGDDIGEKRQATLHGGAASLTETVCRALLHRRDGAEGEDAR